MRTADFRTFVPVDSEPAEAVEDWLECRFDVSLLIGVIDPQDELSLVMASEQPVEQSSANAADMEMTGGAGSETSPNGGHGRAGR